MGSNFTDIGTFRKIFVNAYLRVTPTYLYKTFVLLNDRISYTVHKWMYTYTYQ